MMEKIKQQKVSDAALDYRVASSKARGICSTCVHSEDCNYMANSTEPIWMCEEFDTGSFLPEQGVSSTDMLSAREIVRETNGKHKGICATCEYRDTCKLPAVKGGVWFCEEYV
jgi:hypothetical protein